jgi:hypothetical protein
VQITPPAQCLTGHPHVNEVPLDADMNLSYKLCAVTLLGSALVSGCESQSPQKDHYRGDLPGDRELQSSASVSATPVSGWSDRFSLTSEALAGDSSAGAADRGRDSTPSIEVSLVDAHGPVVKLVRKVFGQGRERSRKPITAKDFEMAQAAWDERSVLLK